MISFIWFGVDNGVNNADDNLKLWEIDIWKDTVDNLDDELKKA